MIELNSSLSETLIDTDEFADLHIGKRFGVCEKLNPRSIGYASMVLGILVMTLTMYVLFFPSYIALPTIIIGVGSIVSALVVTVAIVSSK